MYHELIRKSKQPRSNLKWHGAMSTVIYGQAENNGCDIRHQHEICNGFDLERICVTLGAVYVDRNWLRRSDWNRWIVLMPFDIETFQTEV